MIGVGFALIFTFLPPYKIRLLNLLQLHYSYYIYAFTNVIEYILIYAFPPFIFLLAKRTGLLWGSICIAILVSAPILFISIIFKTYNFQLLTIFLQFLTGFIGIVAGILLNNKFKSPPVLTKILLIMPGALLVAGIALHYMTFAQSYSSRIRNDISDFQIPLFNNAYQVIENKSKNSSMHFLKYKVDVPYPDTGIIDFYENYLKRQNWKIYKIFESSWTTYGSAIKGKEQWFRGYRKSWIDDKKEKVFFINLMYETPIGIIEEPLECKKEWLSTQFINILVEDYDSEKRTVR